MPKRFWSAQNDKDAIIEGLSAIYLFSWVLNTNGV